MSNFSAIGLVAPKCNANIGGVMRAAYCYGAGLIVLSGTRYKIQATDTTKAWRSIPLIHNVEDVFDAIPYDCVPVAVDLVPGAVNIRDYKHPKRAFYIFGPEDGTLGDKVVSRCREAIMIPTHFCMNLAATSNVVLFDRMMKS